MTAITMLGDAAGSAGFVPFPITRFPYVSARVS